MTEYIQQAISLIESEIVGKSQKYFQILGPNQRHFLFTMRYRYNSYIREGKPLFCSEKQLKYMQDLIKLTKNGGGGKNEKE